MGIHVLQRTQQLPISVDTAWEFFSNPRNLSVITPSWLGFEITSELPDRMYAGMLITYKVRPMFGMPITWVSEITNIRAPYMFIDEQRIGPYRLWHHEHHFCEMPGGIESTDIVTYALPFGVLGDLLHPYLVERRLAEIFAFRQRVLTERFGTYPAD